MPNYHFIFSNLIRFLKSKFYQASAKTPLNAKSHYRIKIATCHIMFTKF